MDETLLTTLEPPRFVKGRTLLIAGLGERYNSEASAHIPAQWQRFAPHLGHIPGQSGSSVRRIRARWGRGSTFVTCWNGPAAR